jgi:DNA-binding SARP family transcriptional activator/TolB-like protein
LSLHRLRVFGGLHLEGPGGAAVGIASRRRPLALLAVLAVHGEQGLSRDRAATLLWGDTDDRHALRSLSDALYSIRAELGPDAVLSSATELRLNPAVVESDVVAFTAALRRGDRQAAVEVWGGPLLEGFHVSGAEAFEEWLDTERRRFSGEFGDALEVLTDEARKAGRYAAAVTGLRRLAALDPYNSRIALELARTLAQSRDPGNAVQVLREHTELLRSALGAEPDPAVVRLMGELRAGAGRVDVGPDGSPRSFRSVFDTGSGDGWGTDDGAGVAAVPAVPGEHRSAVARAMRSVAARPALAILAPVALVVAGWGAVRLAQARFGPRVHRLAVLPLRNLTGDSSVGPFVDGVTEELTARLSRVAELQVTSRTSATVFRDSTLTSARIAAALGVDGLIEGAVVRWGDLVRVTVQSIDARSDRHLGAETLEGPPESLPGELADAVLRSLRVRPSAQERSRIARPGSRDPRVAALIARGRWQEALALDSTSARAWAERALQLVDSTWLWPPKAEWRPSPFLRAAAAAAARAVRLDSTESSAHHALGAVAMANHDYVTSERELRRAIALNPSNARARGDLAELLALLGHDDEAVAEVYRAKRLAPLSGRVLVDVNWVLIVARRWDAYEAEEREQLRRGPDDYVGFAGGSRFIATLCAGRPREALATVDSTRTLMPSEKHRNDDLGVAIILAHLGQKDSALAIIRRAERITDVYVRRFWLAWAYAAVGEMDRAVYAYRDAAAMGETGLRATVLTCLSDPLRSDPRWPELLRLLNLAP